MFVGCHQSDLETPACCLDLEALDERAQTLASLWNGSGQRWWPGGCELELADLARRLRDLGAFGITRDTLPSALSGNQAGIDRQRLNLFTLDSHRQALFSTIPPAMDLLLTCDHYAQAEILSRLALEQGRRFPVLMEVNLGLNRTGVRPGADARDLAHGLRHLPGIQVVGVCGHLDVLSPVQAQETRWLQSRVKLLTHLLPELPQAETAPLQVHVVASGSVECLAEFPDVTDVSTGSLLPRHPWSHQPSPLRLISRVISRSKLERAVLDAGRIHTGSSSPQVTVTATAFGRSLPDVQSIEIAERMTTLTLGPESLDLIIGDTVEIGLPDPVLAWELHPTLYGVRGGHVEAIWHRSSTHETSRSAGSGTLP